MAAMPFGDLMIDDIGDSTRGLWSVFQGIEDGSLEFAKRRTRLRMPLPVVIAPPLGATLLEVAPGLRRNERRRVGPVLDAHPRRRVEEAVEGLPRIRTQTREEGQVVGSDDA